MNIEVLGGGQLFGDFDAQIVIVIDDQLCLSLSHGVILALSGRILTLK